MSDKKYTIAELEQHRKDWIKALSSGKYKQGRTYLRNGDNYCCLGIACELTKEILNLSVTKFGRIYQYDTNSSTLPINVQQYYGFLSGVGSNKYDDAQNNKNTSLWILNDKDDFSFDEIADHVETHWNEYFSNVNAIDYVDD